VRFQSMAQVFESRRFFTPPSPCGKPASKTRPQRTGGRAGMRRPTTCGNVAGGTFISWGTRLQPDGRERSGESDTQANPLLLGRDPATFGIPFCTAKSCGMVPKEGWPPVGAGGFVGFREFGRGLVLLGE